MPHCRNCYHSRSKKSISQGAKETALRRSMIVRCLMRRLTSVCTLLLNQPQAPDAATTSNPDFQAIGPELRYWQPGFGT